jgi:hypothetical protein
MRNVASKVMKADVCGVKVRLATIRQAYGGGSDTAAERVQRHMQLTVNT